MSTNVALKTGSLTIAGSGIASVSQMTLETISFLQETDTVFYMVADPVTEAYILKNAKGPCKDLQIFYGKDKSRYDTYVQMAETMLNSVRGGMNVLGIFYGHPGVFVSPTRRALAIAREEGYKAKMLPGVSAEDCLFADLEVDPAVNGCCAYEATELLLKNTPLDTSVNNIIWQVGGVGISKTDFQNSKFGLLVDYLEKNFGTDHVVVHYIGAVLPQSATIKDVFKVSDLREEHVAAQFNTCSTFYIPPLNVVEKYSDDIIVKLFGENTSTVDRALYPIPQWASDHESIPAYSPRERAAVAALAEHSIPPEYCSLTGSAAMQQFMMDLALRPHLQAEYKADPKGVADAVEGLTMIERTALRLNKPGAIFAVMKPSPDSDITQQGVGPSPAVPGAPTVFISTPAIAEDKLAESPAVPVSLTVLIHTPVALENKLAETPATPASLNMLVHTPVTLEEKLSASSAAATSLNFLVHTPVTLEEKLSASPAAPASLNVLVHTPVTLEEKLAASPATPAALNVLVHTPITLEEKLAASPATPASLNLVVHTPVALEEKLAASPATPAALNVLVHTPVTLEEKLAASPATPASLNLVVHTPVALEEKLAAAPAIPASLNLVVHIPVALQERLAAYGAVPASLNLVVHTPVAA